MLDKKNNEFSNIIYTIHQNSELLELLSITIVVYLSNTVIDNYKLYKEFKPKKIISINKPVSLTNISKSNENKILENQFGKYVIEFINVIQEKLPNVNLSYLYNNLKTLDITIKDFKFLNFIMKTKTTADYSVTKNVIRVQKESYLDSIDHELFHMANSFYDKVRNIKFSGFSQSSKLKSIGNGINEGYTQLLTERYFGDIHDVGGSYFLEVHIAKCLEKIIGKEEMEKMYFNADLFGLVQELKKYDSEENVMQFISNIDFVHKHNDDEKLLFLEKSYIQKSLNNIFSFLLKCYSKKLKEEYDRGIIDDDNFKNMLLEYVSDVSSSLTVKNGKKKNIYEFMSIQNIKEILKESLSDFATVNVSADNNENQVSKVH